MIYHLCHNRRICKNCAHSKRCCFREEYHLTNDKRCLHWENSFWRIHVQILTTLGNPLRVQWLGRHTFNGGCTSLIPGRRTKIPHATQKKKGERFLFNIFDVTIFMHLSIIHSKCLSCRDTKIMLLLKKKMLLSLSQVLLNFEFSKI